MPDLFSRRFSNAFSPPVRIRPAFSSAATLFMLIRLQTLVRFLGVKRIV